MAASGTVRSLSQALKPIGLLGGRLGNSARVSPILLIYSGRSGFAVYIII